MSIVRILRNCTPSLTVVVYACAWLTLRRHFAVFLSDHSLDIVRSHHVLVREPRFGLHACGHVLDALLDAVGNRVQVLLVNVVVHVLGHLRLSQHGQGALLLADQQRHQLVDRGNLVGAIGVQERVQLLVIGRFRVAFGWSKNKVQRRVIATPMSAEGSTRTRIGGRALSCPFARTSRALRLLLAKEEELLWVGDFAHELLSELVDVSDARETRVVHAQADQRQFGTLGVLEARVACAKRQMQTTIATAKRMSVLQSQPTVRGCRSPMLLLLLPAAL